ncbi:uncharacterized protein LOC119112259 [Pollicipes pollicipes]|uniref:uncharacterized protein LOC119112259 n=1 Tax=Pollicipes pollicipes TaxID=41117 RepID=UPI0018859C26|nr:uncharacterized protein LOC119112259 [Pollicipes pollicipes]XP_037092258.1 uncharacterized protein LOC119112259 [Pollicipes pollicipes]
MDWEKKFNNIIRDTDANLEKVKSRVMLSHCSTGGGSTPGRADRVAMAAVTPPAGPAAPGLAELHALLQQQAGEIKRIHGMQRRQELESEYIRGELSRLRRDLRKMPPATETERNRQREPGTVARDDLVWRLTQLERRVIGLEDARRRETTPGRPLVFGTSPLACVDDHFPAEVTQRTPPAPTAVTEPLGFNLDDLALSDSDDH